MHCSDWINSIYLFSSLMDLSSVISILLLSPYSKFSSFGYYIFSVLEFLFGSFIYYLFCQHFLVLHLFQLCLPSLVGVLYSSCFKVFVRYFQYACHLAIDIFFSFSIGVKVFLVLHILSKFKLHSGHLEYYGMLHII